MNKSICACSKCGKPIYLPICDINTLLTSQRQDIKDKFIYSNDGILKYIELYHAKCERLNK